MVHPLLSKHPAVAGHKLTKPSSRQIQLLCLHERRLKAQQQSQYFFTWGKQVICATTSVRVLMSQFTRSRTHPASYCWFMAGFFSVSGFAKLVYANNICLTDRVFQTFVTKGSEHYWCYWSRDMGTNIQTKLFFSSMPRQFLCWPFECLNNRWGRKQTDWGCENMTNPVTA